MFRECARIFGIPMKSQRCFHGQRKLPVDRFPQIAPRIGSLFQFALGNVRCRLRLRKSGRRKLFNLRKLFIRFVFGRYGNMWQ